MSARIFVFFQYLLPRHLLTALVYRIARIRTSKVKDFLITRFIKAFDVATDEIKLDAPGDFATFNDFFIRQLKTGVRPIDTEPGSVVSPVDGTVSSAGHLRAGSIFQAKGLRYTLDDLLATELDDATAYVDGSYATIYLAPYNTIAFTRQLAAKLLPPDTFPAISSVSTPIRSQNSLDFSAATNV